MEDVLGSLLDGIGDFESMQPAAARQGFQDKHFQGSGRDFFSLLSHYIDSLCQKTLGCNAGWDWDWGWRGGRPACYFRTAIARGSDGLLFHVKQRPLMLFPRPSDEKTEGCFISSSRAAC